MVMCVPESNDDNDDDDNKRRNCVSMVGFSSSSSSSGALVTALIFCIHFASPLEWNNQVKKKLVSSHHLFLYILLVPSSPFFHFCVFVISRVV